VREDPLDGYLVLANLALCRLLRAIEQQLPPFRGATTSKVVMMALLDQGLATATRGNPTFPQRLVGRIPLMDQPARGSR
jgi:hypothetical protein